MMAKGMWDESQTVRQRTNWALRGFDSSDRVVEFVRGTALIPYMERLNDAECAQFLAELKKQIRDAYPASKNGTVLFAFQRMFFVAKESIDGKR